MRVLIVNAHGADPTYGGAEQYVRDLVTGLSARGHAVEVLSAFPQPREPEFTTYILHQSDWRSDQLRRLRNHVGDFVSAPWPRLEAVLRAARPELVHTNNLPGIGTGIWELARRLGIPVVHSLHDYHLLCPRTSLTWRDGSECEPHPLLCGARTRRLTRWQGAVDSVIAVSEYVCRVYRRFFPSASKHVIRPPLAPLSGPIPQPPRTPPVTLGFLGALTAIKGVRVLLDAAPLLARQGLELRFAGDGALRREVEAAEDVEYEGRVDREDLASFMGACDAGVVPSLWNEPGPFVVGEWLAAGRPVLATRLGGLSEAERRGGMVAFDGSAEALVAAALRLRDEDEWRRILATIPIVDGNADVERWLDAHETAYASAIERAATRPRSS